MENNVKCELVDPYHIFIVVWQWCPALKPGALTLNIMPEHFLMKKKKDFFV